jgi:hypothetical protein
MEIYQILGWSEDFPIWKVRPIGARALASFLAAPSFPLKEGVTFSNERYLFLIF